jgi:hypothetical protein
LYTGASATAVSSTLSHKGKGEEPPGSGSGDPDSNFKQPKIAIASQRVARTADYAFADPPYRLRETPSYHPVHRAELVAVGIAQVREIEFARGTFAHARRVFADLGAVGDAGRVQASACSGELAAKPMVPPLAGVAGLPSIGFDTENTPVGVM